MGLRAITCRECGIDVIRGSPAVYCAPCASARHGTRISKATPKRSGERGLMLNGVWVCLECKAPVQGAAVKGRPPLRCNPCGHVHRERRRTVQGKEAAHFAVRGAVAAGDLPPATERICVDCGAQADCYDHRDYSRPLAVEPVCFSCNLVRGPAKPITAPVEA